MIYRKDTIMSKKLLFIFNPHSGKTTIKAYVADIIDMFVKEGYDVEVYPTQQRGGATEKVASDGERFDHIVCSGGDGTLNEVINGLMKLDKRPTLGYIPTGSTNDFANGLNIPSNMTEAAKIAVSGEDFSIDIGNFNGFHFVYIAAFGAFTEVSYSTPQDLKNIFAHQAYLIEGIKQFPNLRAYHVKFDLDGDIIEDDFMYAMITNATSAGGFKGITGKDILLNDGLFEITLIKKIDDIAAAGDVLSVLTGLREDAPCVIKRKVKKVTVTSEEEISWTTDGEFAGAYKEASIGISEKAVTIKSSTGIE